MKLPRQQGGGASTKDSKNSLGSRGGGRGPHGWEKLVCGCQTKCERELSLRNSLSEMKPHKAGDFLSICETSKGEGSG